MKLKAEEQETILSMTGDDHSQWTIVTDDPIMIRKMNKIIKGTQVKNSSAMQYVIDANQVIIRKKPKKAIVTDEQRLKRSEHMKILRTKKVNE